VVTLSVKKALLLELVSNRNENCLSEKKCDFRMIINQPIKKIETTVQPYYPNQDSKGLKLRKSNQHIM
jgi:hypothetical protein